MNKLKSLILSIVVGGSVLGALGAGAAYAQPKINTTSGFSCEIFDVHGNSVAYPPGTKWTITMTDGTKETYTCDGNTGTWVKTARVLPGKISGIQSVSLTRVAR